MRVCPAELPLIGLHLVIADETEMNLDLKQIHLDAEINEVEL